MKRVLFISSAHPGGSGVVGAGEGIAAINLQSLIDDGYEVHVVVFAFDNQFSSPCIVSKSASYSCVRQTLFTSFMGIMCNIHNGSFVAPWFFTRVSKSNLKYVFSLLKKYRISKVWLEFPSSLGFSVNLKYYDLDYFVHDIVTQKISRRIIYSFFYKKICSIEFRLMQFVSRCYVLSDKDLKIVKSIGFDGDITVRLPRFIQVSECIHALPISRFVASFEGKKNLVFFGNMKRPENHWSIMRFLIFQYPKLRKAIKDLNFWIIGMNPRLSLRILAKIIPGVEVTGAVDNPRDAFAFADVCIVPLKYGAGVKIKTLQMLEAGARVVATSIGAEGVEPHPNLIIEDDDFNLSIIKIINSCDVTV